MYLQVVHSQAVFNEAIDNCCVRQPSALQQPHRLIRAPVLHAAFCLLPYVGGDNEHAVM